jgi:hypothetical protein
MSSTESSVRSARCMNVAECAKAAAGEALEWYSGAGEYCPECGEALASAEPGLPAAQPVPSARASPWPGPAGPTSPSPALAGGADLLPKLRFKPRLRSFWIVAAAFVVSAAVVYHVARPNFAIGNAPGGIVAVCPIPIAQQLAADLVRGYAAKSAISADRFVLTDSAPCDVRFSTTPDTPEDVIARDGIVAVVNPLNMISRISEKELREIFSGTIRNWSQVGMAPGAIVPILPDAASDEARALKSSLFFGVAIAHGVRRSGSSADVARGVAGTDRASRNAIGLVAFSQSVTAKVVPLADFPPPSVLSIASHGYPYTLTIAMHAAPKPSVDAAAGLIGFARSSDGAAIVLKNGLIPREGL